MVQSLSRCIVLLLPIRLLVGQESVAAWEQTNNCRVLTYAMLAMPEDDRVSADQILVIEDLDAFLNARKIEDKSARHRLHRSQMFVLEASFPIYVNAPNCRRFTATAVQPAGNIVLMFAGMLVHERVHATGERSEARAYARELEVLHDFQKHGWLRNAGAGRYIDAIEALRFNAVADERARARKFKKKAGQSNNMPST